MQVYIYAKSGHAIGLEATRRCASIAHKLKDFDPILATCDFRAGAYAKSELGVKKYVNVDLLTNLPNMMQRGDILIFDTDESTEFMESHMKEFCSLVYKIETDIPYSVYDDIIFKKNDNPKYEESFFFGDDDYDNKLLKFIENCEKLSFNLLWGHYFFLGNEKILSTKFEKIFEDEEYVDVISNSRFLLTTSLISCLESIACGNKPILLRRKDKIYDEILINNINIPTINYSENFDEILSEYSNIKNIYPKLNNFDLFDFKEIYSSISDKLELFKKISS